MTEADGRYAERVQELETARARVRELEAALAESNATRSRAPAQPDLPASHLLAQIAHVGGVVNKLPEIIWIKDLDGRLIVVNDLFAEVCGQPIEAIVGRTDEALFPADIAAFFRADDQRVVESRRTTRNEFKFATPAGPRTFASVKTPIFARNGAVVGTLGMARDVSPGAGQQPDSESRYRALVESQRDLVVRVDPEGRFTFVNDSYCEFVGIPREQLLGTYFHPRVHPEDLKNTLGVMEGLLHPPHRIRVEQRVRVPSGLRWVEWEDYAITGEQGEIVEIQAVGRDVHERHLAEAARRSSEENFRTLIETTQAATFIYRGEVIEFANPAAEQLTGYSAAELCEMRFWDLAHPDFRTLVQQRGRAREAGDDPPSEYEVQIITKRGEVRWVRAAAARIQYNHRPSVLVTSFDITALKHAEQAVRESEQRYRSVVENVADGVCIVVDGRIVYASPALGRMGEIAPEEYLGRSPLDFIDPRQHAEARPWLKNLPPDGTSSTAIFDVQLLNGKRKTVEVVASQIRHEGRPAALHLLRDVTQRQRVEAERRALDQQLAEARQARAVEQVAAGIAHDFANLLQVAQAACRRLRTHLARGTDGDEGEELLDTLDRSLAEALAVSRSYLTFSRRLPSQRTPLPFVSFVEEAVHVLRHLAPQLRLRVEHDQRDELWIYGDSAQLQQVLLNLTLNARDAMPDAGELRFCITAETRLTDTGKELHLVQLVVADTGPGIPPHLHERVFEPFFSTRPAQRGTGLGLSLVRSIIEDHNGTVRVESDGRTGSAFIMELPVARAPQPAAEQHGSAPDGQGADVLIIEPNRHLRRLLVSALQRWRFRPSSLTAEAAENALAAGDCRPALVVLNVSSADTTIQKLLARCRSANPALPTILVRRSGNVTMPEGDPRTMAVLEMPFIMAEFGRVVDRLLRSSDGGNRGCPNE